MYMFFLDQVTKCLQCEGELSIVCSFTPSGEWPVTKPVWFRASTMGCFKADIQQKVKELQQLLGIDRWGMSNSFNSLQHDHRPADGTWTVFSTSSFFFFSTLRTL